MSPTNMDASGTSGSSTSSNRFDLDPKSTSDIFVYQVRSGANVTSQKDLCARLDADPTHRCSKVRIPRGASRVHIQAKDLFPEPERSRYADYPNGCSSVASVGLPRMVYWRRLLMGDFPELYIVSPDHSPASSENSSPDDSRHVTPSGTFHVPNDEVTADEGESEQRGRREEQASD